MIYILVEKNPIKPIGIFSTEELARGNAFEGDYLIIPVELNRRYNARIVDEAMVGAITVKAKGTELSVAVDLVLSRLDTIDNQITFAAGKLSDFETRIAALEGG